MLGHDINKLTGVAGAAAKLSITTLAGSYDFGAAKLYAGYEQGKSTGDVTGTAYPANAAGGTNSLGFFGVIGKDKGVMVGVAVPIGAMTLNLGYAREKSADSQGFGFTSKTTAFAGQLVYSLSKRSNVYVDFLQGKTTDPAGFITGLTAKNSIFGVGMRHDF